jgi:hypothetical protein
MDAVNIPKTNKKVALFMFPPATEGITGSRDQTHSREWPVDTDLKIHTKTGLFLQAPYALWLSGSISTKAHGANR